MTGAARRLSLAAGFLFMFLLASAPVGCSPTISPNTTASAGPTTSSPAPAIASDAVFARAFADHANGLEVEGRGTVQRLLADDTTGERHQRFIVQLASGQTLLIAHNIDVAARVAGLQVGDTVSFKGEYEWNGQGGLVHWTHRDPGGSHPAGWIEDRGKTYQ
jgi:hypothetical protein